mgnify:CR=1 FL=1
MGYRCDVRIATTGVGLEKIKEMAKKNYAETLSKLNVVEEDERTVTTMGDAGFKVCYEKELWLIDHLHVYAWDKTGKYVLFGWDDIKWMGYTFKDIMAIEKAMAECGEPVRFVAIGEDGQEQVNDWGDDDYSMPYVDTLREFDFDSGWDMQE